MLTGEPNHKVNGFDMLEERFGITSKKQNTTKMIQKDMTYPSMLVQYKPPSEGFPHLKLNFYTIGPLISVLDSFHIRSSFISIFCFTAEERKIIKCTLHLIKKEVKYEHG
jgi:hypothetical protein